MTKVWWFQAFKVFFSPFKHPSMPRSPPPPACPHLPSVTTDNINEDWRLVFCWGFLNSLLMFKKEKKTKRKTQTLSTACQPHPPSRDSEGLEHRHSPAFMTQTQTCQLVALHPATCACFITMWSSTAVLAAWVLVWSWVKGIRSKKLYGECWIKQKGVTNRISVTMCTCGFVYKVFPLMFNYCSSFALILSLGWPQPFGWLWFSSAPLRYSAAALSSALCFKWFIYFRL